jgi:AraC-like DNA-binding protein
MKTGVDDILRRLELPKERWYGTAIGNISLQNRVNLGGAVSIIYSDDYYYQHDNIPHNPEQPDAHTGTRYFTIQYTLEGHGLFKKQRRFQKVKPGHAFCCFKPSVYTYKNDTSCPKYRFLWFSTNHPYIVSRLEKHPNLHNSIIKLSLNSPIIQSIIQLIRKCASREEDDDLVIEQLLFGWMFQLENWAIENRFPQKNRTYLLEYVRNYTLEHLSDPFRISVMAKAYGRSRSNFTHHFTAMTGFTPAAYVNEIRLEESTRLLKDTQMPVKEIASKTGFSNSNHFCKTFKKHFRISATAYRKNHSPLTKQTKRKLPG